MLHFTGTMTSWRGKSFILSAEPGGWDSFQSALTAGIGWILWLVGSLFLMSMFWPAMTPMTWGWYMQPIWLSSTVVVGTCHTVVSGSPDFTHTKAFLSVPLSLTMTSSDFGGAPLWAFMHVGTADMSRVFITGLAPSKTTLPVMVAPLVKSGVAAPPAGAAVSACLVSVFSPPPQPAKVSALTTPTAIQIFFILKEPPYSNLS